MTVFGLAACSIVPTEMLFGHCHSPAQSERICDDSCSARYSAEELVLVET